MTEENDRASPKYLKEHLLQITVDTSLTSSAPGSMKALTVRDDCERGFESS